MRLAHITDLHLRHHQPGTAAQPSRRSRLMPALLERVLADVRAAEPDLLAVTGDLLDMPLWVWHPVEGFTVDEPAWWAKAAEDDYRLVKDLLDAAGVPYMVLPGNHDWSAVMWRVFDADDNVRDIAGRRVVRFCDYEHTGHVPRRFHPSRTLMEEQLTAADAGPRQVHLQHYVLTPDLSHGYPHTYGDADALLQAIARSGRVDLCLSGHYHRGTELIERGGTTFTTAPAFCEAPFPWRLYELSDGHVTLHEQSLGVSAQPRRPVVYLDRDGVINNRPSYRSGPEDMHLLPGAAQAVRLLSDAGYAVVVITNQSCVGAGYVPPEVLHAVNDKMGRLLVAEAGAHLDAIYYAAGAGDRAVLPAYRDRSACKPNPALLKRARNELNLEEAGGWMVGDTLTDAQAAAAAGVQPVLVRTGHGADQEAGFRAAFPDAPVVADLRAAVELILAPVQR